jgi:hypothetical protein
MGEEGVAQWRIGKPRQHGHLHDGALIFGEPSE